MESRIEDGRLVVMLAGKVDSGNAGAVETDLDETIAAGGVDAVTIDASTLDYISSAGLRVLLKLHKRLGNLSVVETSPEVYEVFEVTGFSQLMDVSKRPREVSVEGCELVGQGGNGKVYRLDDDKIVKLYHGLGREPVEQEQRFARTALVNGIPCVIPYDVVRCGDDYGVVFEMVHSDTLGHSIAAHPERMSEYVDRYVELARSLHSTHIVGGSIPNVCDLLRERAARLGKWCSDDEIDALLGIIDAMPECDTVLHNDLHPGNIMVQDGELVLIDLAEVTVGPKAMDLSSIYRDMIAGARTEPEVTEMSLGMPVDMVEQVGQLFFMKYTGITDPAALKGYFDQIGLIFAFNTVLLAGAGVVSTEAYAPQIMENLLRPVVLPNKDALPYLISTL